MQKNRVKTILPYAVNLDHQRYWSIFIRISNEMVNTGNHTVTMLIFSFPMITDDKNFIHVC